MYRVTAHHHCKAWRHGDLEDELKLLWSQDFRTRKYAKDHIEAQLTNSGTIQRHYHKGDTPSYVIQFTGRTWQHENSGEEMEEYYQYTLKKVKLR